MQTLEEIETAAAELSSEQQRILVQRLQWRLDRERKRGVVGKSILDLPTFDCGRILKPILSDDRLGDMLEGKTYGERPLNSERDQ